MTKVDFIGKCLLLRNVSKKTGKEKKILVIGDLHLGYEEALNKTGVFVTRQMFEEMIKELDLIFNKAEEKFGEDGSKKIDEIILLGDVKHVFGTIMKQEWGDVLRLFDYLAEKGKKIVIVEGNHDAILEPIVKQRKEIQLEEFYVDHNVIFIHGDKDFEQIWDKEIDIVVAGHIHPAIKLTEGIKTEKYKCFLDGLYKNKRFILVPSFSEYSEGIDVRERDMEDPWKINWNKFNVLVVDSKELKVLSFGELRKIR